MLEISDVSRIVLIIISILFIFILIGYTFKNSKSSKFKTICYHIILALYIVNLVYSINTESNKTKTAHIIVSIITFLISLVCWFYYLLKTPSNNFLNAHQY